MPLRNAIALAIAAWLATPAAHALSFGRAPASALLGSPLNFPVTVRLEPGESLTPECVGADVQVGDRRLQPSDTRVRLEFGASPNERVIRVTSAVAVDEPVLTVTVHAGCSGRLSRRFTTLVDPPSGNAPSMAPPVLAEVQPVSPALDAALSSSSAASPAAATVSATPSATPSAIAGNNVTPTERLAPRPRRDTAQRAERSAMAQRPARVSRPPANGAAPGTLAAAPTGAAAGEAPPRAKPRRTAATRPAEASVAQAAASGQARLRLEAADPLEFPPRRQTSASGVPGGTANLPPVLGDLLMASEAASAAAARVQALERSVQALQSESKNNRELMVQMRERIAANEFWARLAPWLGGALAVVSGLALMLGLGLRRSRAEQRQWWNQVSPDQAAAAQGSSPPVAAVAGAAPAAGLPATAGLVAGGAAAAMAALAATRLGKGGKVAGPGVALHEPTLPPGASAPATMPMADPDMLPAATGGGVIRPADPLEFDSSGLRDLGTTDSGNPPRAVAIDELIDLEQQADFFIALGQDDSAVDLLVGHIRGSGGVSPMAYLKLLEIYRRKGDLESYERTRNRFNHRFNAVAPEWGADLQAGRPLEAYPDVLQRLSAVWPDSLHTQAELEALMFRRDGGESFDLPAYRELLFLLALARDNLDAEGRGADTGVDLLLPLGDPGELLTAPAPLSFEPMPLPLSGGAVVEPAGFTLDVVPSAPGGLDLNLSSGPMPISPEPEFGVVRVVDGDLDLKLSPPPPAGPSRR
jgi:hypothetical protein